MSTKNNIKVVNKNISAERLGLLREECQRLGKMLEEQIQQHYFRWISFNKFPEIIWKYMYSGNINKLSGNIKYIPEKLYLFSGKSDILPEKLL